MIDSHISVDFERISGMSAKVRDEVLWLVAEYRKLDAENQELRKAVLKVADTLEDYGLKKDDEVIRISNKLRSLLWT